jgi:hypothetical protein
VPLDALEGALDALEDALVLDTFLEGVFFDTFFAGTEFESLSLPFGL